MPPKKPHRRPPLSARRPIPRGVAARLPSVFQRQEVPHATWTILSGVSALALGAFLALAHDPHEAPSAGGFDLDSPRHPSEQTARYIGLRTAEADFGSAERIVRLTGTVRPMPERTRMVTSAVPGTLTRLDARVGQRVKMGDAVGEIRSAELARMTNEMHKTEIDFEHAESEVTMTRSNIAQLRNQVGAAETQAGLLEEEVQRLEAGGEAVGSNALSQKRSAAVQQRAQERTLRISLVQAEQTVASLEKIKVATGKSIAAMRGAIEIIHDHPANIDPKEERLREGDTGGVFVLHAPIDGIITQRDGVPGQGVEPGKPILTVVDDSEMLIEGELPESLMADFAGIAVVSPVQADNAAPQSDTLVRIRRPGATIEEDPIALGRVRGMSPTVDPIKRTAHLLIAALNDGAADGRAPLREGMFVSLAVQRARAPGAGSPDGRTVVVPVGAVVSDGAMQFVFVKDGDAYIKRDIVPGARDDKVVEIREGLAPGDIVVTHGAYLLTQLRPKAAALDHDDHHHH